jgi:hypothetical protein
LNNKDPEPNGEEGLADVRIIRAMFKAAETGTTLKLDDFTRSERPSLSQAIDKPPVTPPKLVHAEDPSAT